MDVRWSWAFMQKAEGGLYERLAVCCVPARVPSTLIIAPPGCDLPPQRMEIKPPVQDPQPVNDDPNSKPRCLQPETDNTPWFPDVLIPTKV